jgi:stearoyl-CoA desaturase (delta-9 desaturase)
MGPRAGIAHESTGPGRSRSAIDWAGAIPFVLCHLVVFAAIFTGVTWQAVLVCIVLYVVRMFGVTAGYHRYFSHRSFATSRAFQLVLALLAQSSAQKSVLWWAAHHRHHHLHSDDPADRHSPAQHGFLESHVGWVFREDAGPTDLARVADLAKYPELRWLHRHWLVPPAVLAILVLLLFGWSGLVIGFFLSTVLTWHGTYTINSLSHVLGSRRFATKDTSRNNPFLALLTLGEGWHNNHHHYPNAARCGFYPRELDVTYLGLRLLEKLGLVWGLKAVPGRVLEAGRDQKLR